VTERLAKLEGIYGDIENAGAFAETILADLDKFAGDTSEICGTELTLGLTELVDLVRKLRAIREQRETPSKKKPRAV